LKRLLIVAALSALCEVAAAQAPLPERTVTSNVVVSQHDPAVRIALPKEAAYLGAERFVLYGVADCEIHLFVEADAQRVVKRLYWIQFEGYLPSTPGAVYGYKFERTLDLGGMRFDVRPRFGPSQPAKEGSDSAKVQAMLHARGYTEPASMMNVRLVHLTDATKRRELMLIYAEDLKETGFTAEDLMPGGRGSALWPEIEKSLVERAQQRVQFAQK
jgi:hypothetical protein